jgi:hypothetical protein
VGHSLLHSWMSSKRHLHSLLHWSSLLSASTVLTVRIGYCMHMQTDVRYRLHMYFLCMVDMLDAGCWMLDRWTDGGWTVDCWALHAGWWTALQGKMSVVQFLVNGRLTPGRDSWFDSDSSSCQTRIYNKPVQLCMYDSLRLRLHNQHQQASGVPDASHAAAA